MTTTRSLPDLCDLCSEVRLNGTAATRSYDDEARTAPYSRLIRRTSVVDVLAGLGSVAPGYALVMPRRHVWSTGELTIPELMHVFDVAWETRDQIARTFGGDVALVEHGSSGQKHSASGACIDHAHIHLFPLSPGTDPYQFVVPGSQLVSDITDLSSIAQLEKNYYFCAFDPLVGHVSVDPRLESQQARRIWARTLGRHDEWDWAVFPFMANAMITSARLGPSSTPAEETEFTMDDARLSETLQAYDEAADWYAARTQAFDEQSSLREEMTWLVNNTDGSILDAGTGAGRDAAYLASFDRPVTALDASAPLLSYVPKRKNISTRVGDVRRLLQLKSNSFGAIWCSAVLLHLRRDDVLKTLKEFTRILEPSGLAEISVKEGSGHSVSTMPLHPWLKRHFFFYNGEELQLLAREAGLEVVKTWTEEEMDSSQVTQRWVKLLLRKP